MEKSNYFYGITRYWWLPMLTGLVFIGFGIWCLCDPSASLPILAYIFAGCLGAIGIFNVLYGLCNTNSSHSWGWAIAAGIIEILFAIWLFFIPSNILTVFFVYGVGVYIIFMSVISFCESFMMSNYSSSLVWWLLLFLIAALVFALIFILGPIGGAIIGWLYIGISFICYGIYRILLSVKLNQINRDFK